MTNILVVFHSGGGRVFGMATEVAAGVTAVPGCTALLRKVPALPGSGAIYGPRYDEAADCAPEIAVATVADLAAADGIAIGTPVHFGSMSSAMRFFLDQCGAYWMEGTLTGKPATVFVAAGSGSGREAAILSVWSTLAVLGLTIVPLGTRAKELGDLSEAHGATPFGAGTVAAGPGDRPSPAERRMARIQGQALAQTALALSRR